MKKSSGEIIAYDPRCTHGLCSYGWLPDAGRFRATATTASSRSTATVISGKPTPPLRQFPVRVTGDVIEVDVPGNFETPKESLPPDVGQLPAARAATGRSAPRVRERAIRTGAGRYRLPGASRHRPVSQFYPPTDANASARAR